MLPSQNPKHAKLLLKEDPTLEKIMLIVSCWNLHTS